MKKNKKEKGSAIILAILLLSFFMALSLNMFFLAQKKSERAGIKAKGIKVFSNIDGGASIAYYELKKASDYVTVGIDIIPKTTETAIVSETTTASAVRGVVLENYNQYMSERISGTATQAAIYLDDGSDPKNWVRKSKMDRIWKVDPSSINGDSDMSIGGYKITKDENSKRDLKLNGVQKDKIENISTTQTSEINVSYEKYLLISGGENIGNLKYKIVCQERYKTTSSGAVDTDDIVDMTVTFWKNRIVKAVSETEKLKNYMEHLVDETLNNYLNEKNDICKCEKCRLDIKAYALNKLPPHYIVSDKGYLHWKMDEMRTQFNVDVLKAVIDGVEKINNNKRH